MSGLAATQCPGRELAVGLPAQSNVTNTLRIMMRPRQRGAPLAL